MRFPLHIERMTLPLCGVVALLLISGNDAGARELASLKSYFLVTQMRPENLKKVFQRERGVHQMCTAGAKLKNISVKPFPTLPPDFVMERRIYASDGKRTFYKETHFKVDGASVEQGCAYKVTSTATSDIAQGGKARRTEQDELGALTTGDEMPDTTEPVSKSKLDRYTEAKVMKGVQLKCQGADCIVDPSLVVIALGRRPVVVVSRMDDESLFGTALITEPVSLTVGKPFDLSEFKQQSGK